MQQSYGIYPVKKQHMMQGKLKILAEAIEIIYEKENPTIEDLINLQKFLKGLSCIFRTDDFQCIWANGFVVDFLEEVEIHVS
jgi:hypothetical protein